MPVLVQNRLFLCIKVPLTGSFNNFVIFEGVITQLQIAVVAQGLVCYNKNDLCRKLAL